MEYKDLLIELCENVKLVDKTPRYQFGQSNNLGERPNRDLRWFTPSELADFFLTFIDTQYLEEYIEEDTID